MVAKFQDLNDPSWRWWLFALSNNGRKVWATVLFPSAIMHPKVILYMLIFFFLLRIYRTVDCWDPEILLPWQHDVTISPFYKVCMHLESPWNLQSVLTLSNSYSQVPKRSTLHRKTFRIKLLMWWKNEKTFECSPWKMGNESLKVLEKCLNFFVQKRVRNLFLITFMEVEFNQLSTLDGSKIFPLF